MLFEAVIVALVVLVALRLRFGGAGNPRDFANEVARHRAKGLL